MEHEPERGISKFTAHPSQNLTSHLTQKLQSNSFFHCSVDIKMCCLDEWSRNDRLAR